jgi:hypothetical protein
MSSMLLLDHRLGLANDSLRPVLMLVVATLISAAALVATRSRGRQAAVAHEHRQRPATDELLDHGDAYVGDGSSYVIGMLGWVEAVNELLDHAISVGGDAASAALVAAREDSAALHELLSDAVVHHPHSIAMVRLHSACFLWEADQSRLEEMSAEVDAQFHRRWRARTIIARQLRRGDPVAVR